jgi:hypothetical protein
VNILQAVDDEELFRPWFRDPETWRAWRAFLAALFALPMTEEQREIFTACTGRQTPPVEPFGEAWLVCGRRSGKSLTLALVAVFMACFKDWSAHLAPGERGVILVLASDRRQSRVIFRYAKAFLEEVPLLAGLVEKVTAEEIELSNKISLEISAASFRSVRGYTIVAALCDEIAYWRSEESANPDREILDALRPAMATVPGSMLLCASSPYARRGALWEAYRRWHGQDGAPVLTWQAPTATMNSSVPEAVIAAAYERDPAAAQAEYGAQFRSDIAGFVAREVIDAATVPGRYELPRLSRNRYVGFVDPSGGAHDAMTIAIAHQGDGRAVLDAVREQRPPFSPEQTVAEFAELLKSYGISRVTGDRFGGEWPREGFRNHKIEYDVEARAKSDLYKELLPALNSGKVELLDVPRLVTQLAGLERRTARGGRDSIDHAPGGSDDVANAAAGALLLAAGKRRGEYDRSMRWVG